MEKKVYELNFRGKKLSVELNELAKQAQGACLVRYEDTVVLSVCCVGKTPITQDFFPLTVLYQEKLYSNGKIPGGWLRREGKATEHETLVSRVIDRPLRPLFKDGFRNEVQVINTVLSCNPDNSPAMTALFGSSLCLALGGVPIEAPIAGVNIGRINGEFVVNPSQAEKEISDIDLTISATEDAINMVEAGAKEVSEDDMCDAMLFAHEAIKELIAFENKIISENAKPLLEIEYKTIPQDIIDFVTPLSKERIEKAVSIEEKLARQNAIEDIEAEVAEACVAAYKEKGLDKDELAEVEVNAISVMEGFMVNEVRRLITEDKIRPDGRKVDEIRPLAAQVDLLPRVHGSALFTRGQTQALAITTLGSLEEAQIIEGAEVEDNKRWMLHYNFPAFSVGEIGRYGAPGRREIGHGALAERALAQVMPSEEDFPYCIRTVSEILESNGSSSQATICASSMSLMAAGVPIKKPVAGIAMGLISDDKNYTILTDIQGLEDHFGDMDFKVAGTEDGITALQMDIKVKGIDRKILSEALAQAHKARLEILKVMNQAIEVAREEVSECAPKIKTTKIEKDQIKDVIGSGGKTINSIIDACGGVKIDISEDGKVIVMHQDASLCVKAIEMIENITRKPELGQIYDAKVVRMESYGVFCELWPGVEGLCHISKLSTERVEKCEDVVKIGDSLSVKIIKIDEKGRIDLSHAHTMEGFEESKKEHKERPSKKHDSDKKFFKKSSKEEKADEDEEVVVVTTETQE